jgi:hypothetical protein
MNRAQLKKQHQLLNEKEPFTEKEKIQYDKKDMSMIRNIQILNKINKKEALKVIKVYKSTTKKTLARLAKTYRERLEKYSSPQKPDSKGEIIAPKIVKEKPLKKSSEIFKINRGDVKQYLDRSSSRDQTGYTRIAIAHKKYIDASRGELRHGVNSKWSQNYRVKHGLDKKYEGRVIK